MNDVVVAVDGKMARFMRYASLIFLRYRYFPSPLQPPLPVILTFTSFVDRYVPVIIKFGDFSRSRYVVNIAAKQAVKYRSRPTHIQ